MQHTLGAGRAVAAACACTAPSSRRIGSPRYYHLLLGCSCWIEPVEQRSMCSHGRRQDALLYVWWVSGTQTRDGRAAAMVQPAAITVARDLVKTRGVAGLYAGVGPSVLRAFLVSGSRFTAYEFAMSHI